MLHLSDGGNMKAENCILFSGAAKGAEAAFGAAAERYGIEEVNFTFDGHNDERSRGIRVLTQAELKQGDVSLNYVGRLMNRSFPDQAVDGWFRWTGESWEAEAEPVIDQVAIAGGGTRVLKDNGLAAINDLFDRSFGG
jgi:hypothetical protein